MASDAPHRTMQHAMNNPLTALMAEIQLLQMEDPSPATAAACDRMMLLVKRLSELSRKLGDFPEDP